MALSVSQIQGLIKTHQAKARLENQRINRYRSYYRSDAWSGSSDEEFPQGSYDDSDEVGSTYEKNYVYPFCDTMVASIVPPNPRITVNAKRGMLEEKAKAQEALINDFFTRTRVVNLLWELATKASVCDRAFVKAVWRDGQPVFLVRDQRFVFYDTSAERWEDVRYVIDITVLTKEEFGSRVKGRGRRGDKVLYNQKAAEKAAFTAYPTWLRDTDADKSLIDAAAMDIFEWVVVYEVYDFSVPGGRFLHVLDNCDEALFEGELPYRFITNNFKKLTFNLNLENTAGMSDVKLIEPSQEELNESLSIKLAHSRASVPATVVNEAYLHDPEKAKTAIISGSQPGAVISIATTQPMPVDNVFGRTPTPSLTPDFNSMMDRAERDIEFILGLPQYSRGVIGAAENATEVAMADTAYRTRSGRRQSLMFEVVQWMAECIIAFYFEFLEDADVLPVRVHDGEPLDISRERIGAGLKAAMGQRGVLDYDYEVVAYSAAENNRLIQLRNISQYKDVLFNNPAVDQRKLMSRLLDLLQMKDILTPAQPQAMPGVQAAAPSADTLATGAMPPGYEPPQAMANMAGGAGAPMPDGQKTEVLDRLYSPGVPGVPGGR